MPVLVGSMNQSLLYLPVLNLVAIGVLLIAHHYITGNSNLRNEEIAVFLSLAKLSPLTFIAMHLYFMVFFLPAFFLLSVPQSLCITWGLENSIIILLWLYVKFHYLRPVELSFKKKAVA